WSPVYTSTNPPMAGGPLTPLLTRSNVVSDATQTRDHERMPAFLFGGNAGLDGTPYELYRVVVSTDQDCLNVVFRGAIVGSPAYVPRETGPLAMPTSTAGVATARASYLGFGSEPTSKTADGMDVRTDEMSGGPDQPAKIDLWDSDAVGGRYYWSVVPVVAAQVAA